MAKKRKKGAKTVEKSIVRPSAELNRLYDFLGIDPSADGDAMSEATYYACVKILSESVGKLPMKLMRRRKRGGVEVIRDHPMARLVSNRPNPYTTPALFWANVEKNRQSGNSIVWIRGAGDKCQLWALPPEDVEIWYDNARILADNPDVYYIYSAAGRRIVLSSEEVLHFRTFDTADGICGIGVIDQLRGTIRANQKGQNVANSLFDSGFTAKAVVQYTGNLNDVNTQTFIQGIERYASGDLSDDGIRNIIPIPLGCEIKPLSMSLADNQFLDLRKFSALQIASAFGVKPYMIGNYDNSSYSSSEQQQLSFLADCLLFILSTYEQELTYKLLTDVEIGQGYFFKANVAALLRADQATQINTLSTAINSFIYTANEARDVLDLPAVEGGDKLIGNGTSIPIDQVGEQYVPSATGGDNGRRAVEDAPEPATDQTDQTGEEVNTSEQEQE